ncbi:MULTISPECIES: hypothetical protein [Actinosynnema]|uniref:Uncharacterized protein n=1 Tax=Actinosynnema pretiosum TaxID=42197 RepID=A0A290ZA19_9PSEU|nr:hypothetical protein [Actinosynnema pretiosum]ATE55822.1 hypothetical protein CNX65_23175 [Actinosynnema pretiosum]
MRAIAVAAMLALVSIGSAWLWGGAVAEGWAFAFAPECGAVEREDCVFEERVTVSSAFRDYDGSAQLKSKDGDGVEHVIAGLPSWDDANRVAPSPPAEVVLVRFAGRTLDVLGADGERVTVSPVADGSSAKLLMCGIAVIGLSLLIPASWVRKGAAGAAAGLFAALGAGTLVPRSIAIPLEIVVFVVVSALVAALFLLHRPSPSPAGPAPVG